MITTHSAAREKTAERLKRGFVFENFSFNAIPDMTDQLKAIEQDAIPEITVPKSNTENMVSGINFGDLDVDGLETYDLAVRTDKDIKASPQQKLKQWEVVIAQVPKLKAEAQKRAEQWRKYIRQLL